jgi:hypothetical protein
MNTTLMEKARCMLNGAGIGQEFWAEAVGISCYLVNRSPSLALGDKTPQEVWYKVRIYTSSLFWKTQPMPPLVGALLIIYP